MRATPVFGEGRTWTCPKCESHNLYRHIGMMPETSSRSGWADYSGSRHTHESASPGMDVYICLGCNAYLNVCNMGDLPIGWEGPAPEQWVCRQCNTYYPNAFQAGRCCQRDNLPYFDARWGSAEVTAAGGSIEKLREAAAAASAAMTKAAEARAAAGEELKPVKLTPVLEPDTDPWDDDVDLDAIAKKM